MRKLIVLISIFSILICCSFTVSAEQIGTNNFFDFDDYATYEILADGTGRATLSLPFEYYTCVDNNLGELLYLQGKSFSFYTSDWFLFSTNPFFEYYYNYDINNPEPPSTFVNGNFFDLDVLPKDFVLTNSFRIDFSGENYHWFESGQAYFVFVDSQGNYLGHKRVTPKLDEYDTYSYCTFTYDTKFDSYAIPANAKGLFVCYALSGNLNTGTTGNMTITYSSMTFDFDLDDAFVNWKNEEIIRESLSNIESSIDELPGEIGDEIQSIIDQEKEESKQEGNKFVDQVLDKLPDPSQGVLSALGELTAAVGYTGTEAVIPFPAIVVPGIAGLYEDIVIYDGSDFDLGACIEYIPETILTVIRSLFTIAIVLFCVYELKGIISFIFTLKEKNNG